MRSVFTIGNTSSTSTQATNRITLADTLFCVEKPLPITSHSVITQPQNVTKNAGQDAVLSLVASDTPTAVAWMYRTSSSGTFQSLTDSGITHTVSNSGASSTLTLSSVAAGIDGYQFRAVLTFSDTSTVTSDAATLTVTNNSSNINILLDTNAPTLAAVDGPEKRTTYVSPNNASITWKAIENAPSGISYGAEITIGEEYSRNTAPVVVRWYDRQNVPVTPGYTYTASFYIKITSGTNAEAHVRMDGRFGWTGWQTTVSGTGWQRVSFTFTAPDSYRYYDAEENYSKTRMCYGVYANYICAVQVCGFKLEEGSTATDWNDGT